MSRILIIEDSPTQSEGLRLTLEGEGFSTTAAPDAEQGLVLAVSGGFDLVVADIMLPGMSGYDLVRRLKSEPRTRDLPVMLLTTLHDVMDIVQGLEAGADNFITKPYEPSYLVGRVQALLAHHRLRAEGRIEVGAAVFVRGRKVSLTAGKEQILELLVSTFEEMVQTYRRLQTSEAELAAAHARIADYAHRLEDRVQASEGKYRTLMERAHDAIFVRTLDGVILEANPKAATLLGLDVDQVVGRNIRSFIADPDAGGFDQVRTLLLRDGAVPLGTMTLKRADGATVIVEFSRALVDLHEERVVVAIGRDVTEQRKVQAQLLVADRMASVGTLAAGVAHEINNPLAALMANLDFLHLEWNKARERLRETGPAGGIEHLERMEEPLREARQTAEQVRRIVRDLKILSRGDEEERGPVEVAAVVESVLRTAANEIRHRARLRKEFLPVPPVQANEGRLGQVLLNLVVNAVQAIPEGAADRNEIRIALRPHETDRVLIEVADTGVGIPPEHLTRIFDPFFTTKPVGIGTGLGLFICQRIVAAFGGTLWAESAPGRGSTFRVALPASSAPRSPSKTDPIGPTPPVRRGRVLVVDDEVVVGRAIQRTLMRDHEIVLVTSGHEALELLFRGERFDVVLCDLMMPVMTGMDLHERLLQTHPEVAERMIFLTGGAFTQRARAFLDEVHNVRLEKPFDPEQLRSAVNDRLG